MLERDGEITNREEKRCVGGWILGQIKPNLLFYNVERMAAGEVSKGFTLQVQEVE